MDSGLNAEKQTYETVKYTGGSLTVFLSLVKARASAEHPIEAILPAGSFVLDDPTLLAASFLSIVGNGSAIRCDKEIVIDGVTSLRIRGVYLETPILVSNSRDFHLDLL